MNDKKEIENCKVDEDILQINWKDEFFSFIATLTWITHGKQQYIEQDDGKIYSRISGEYLTLAEMEKEYFDEMRHYLD